MKKSCRFKLLADTGLILACCGVLFSACTPFSDSSEVPDTAASQEARELVRASDENPYSEEEKSDEPSPEARAVCGEYFKAGDADYIMTVSPGGPESRNKLFVFVRRRYVEPESGYKTSSSLENFELDYREGTEEYSLYNLKEEEISEGEKYKLDMSEVTSGKIGLSYDGNAGPDSPSQSEANVSLGSSSQSEAYDETGDYYSSDLLYMADSLERPLTMADTVGMTEEELRILRNQFFAIYGREFEDESLREYFSSKPWYVASVKAEDFDESIFSGLEKRNIEFLSLVEAELSPEEAALQRKELEALKEAPYNGLLPDSEEIYVEIEYDPEKTVDKEIYYEAYGLIALPVVLTAEQYKEVMEKDGVSEICVDEISGKRVGVRKSDEPNYGDIVLYDIGDEGTRHEAGNDLYHALQVEEDLPSDLKRGFHYWLYYDEYSGNYVLWQSSADTVYKPVYEGVIYVMKGAEEDYVNYFPRIPDRDSEGRAGSWRRIDFKESSEEEPNYTNYNGNVPVFNDLGYLKALYYYGD